MLQPLLSQDYNSLDMNSQQKSIIHLLRYLVMTIVIKPILFILDTLHGYYADKTPNYYLNGNFAPVHQECTPCSLPTSHGALPSDLAGEFVRNGPNPLMIPKAGYHWFDGDGMLHGVKITKDGKAIYVNRQTKTRLLAEELSTGMRIRVRIGELYGVAIGVIDPLIGGTANTALVFHNNKLQALVESDTPYEISILRDGQLETAGRLEYGRKIDAMTAHPKVDPVTNEMFFFYYNVMKTPYVTYGYLDPKGNVVRTVAIDLPEPVMMHDFAITEHFALFLDLSLVFDKKKIVTGFAFNFEDKHNARVGILDRYAKSQDGIMWFPIPPNVIFHTANAWEEGDEVVLITCKSTASFSLNEVAHGNMYGLAEWRFNMKTKEFHEKLIVPECFAEFPQVHPARLGRKLTRPNDDALAGQFSGLIKTNVETKEMVKLFSYGTNKYGGEAVFVPKEGAKDEDDGYLLTFVYDSATNLSSFWVIDAKSMSEIMAIVDLPQRVPYGFHGIFVPEKDVQKQLK